MGKQAEEQQKYGERVGPCCFFTHCVFNYLRTEIKSFLGPFFHFPPCFSVPTHICIFSFHQLAYLQSSLDKLSEAIKLAKVEKHFLTSNTLVSCFIVSVTKTLCFLSCYNQGQPDSVQEALRFTMDVIGGK